MQLPEQQPTRPGQPDTVRQTADQLMAAVDEAIVGRGYGYRDDTPLPAVGSALPVVQPGRPPMSQRATDLSALMLAGGAATVMVGGSASLVMLASGYADPAVCAIICGAPAVLVLAVSRLARRAREAVEAAPATTHNHYEGTVYQDTRTVTSHTRGVIANTRNRVSD
ncbi:hypothetical protein OG786_29340 [Streptomyces sp. NBC_00101]|uniref:hypothetical protein n=1 Tax=Streptomyces sp. NBC_00101 TaxID=2975651 RepID=UPI0032554C2C